MNNFKKFNIYSNWEYSDCLGSVKKDSFGCHDSADILKNGDILEIKFPNKTIEIFTIRVEKSRMRISEQGAGYTTIPISKAYIEIEYHGTKAKIFLTDPDSDLKGRRRIGEKQNENN
jgi:hypothetical protein